VIHRGEAALNKNRPVSPGQARHFLVTSNKKVPKEVPPEFRVSAAIVLLDPHLRGDDKRKRA
jgi:hypothetical protein